jgi:hypothetical protein
VGPYIALLNTAAASLGSCGCRVMPFAAAALALAAFLRSFLSLFASSSTPVSFFSLFEEGPPPSRALAACSRSRSMLNAPGCFAPQPGVSTSSLYPITVVITMGSAHLGAAAGAPVPLALSHYSGSCQQHDRSCTVIGTVLSGWHAWRPLPTPRMPHEARLMPHSIHMLPTDAVRFLPYARPLPQARRTSRYENRMAAVWDARRNKAAAGLLREERSAPRRRHAGSG